METVGVVADVRSNGPAALGPPILYAPLQGNPRGTTGMYVRMEAGPPTALAEAVRDAIWSVDPSQPVGGVLPMTELVGSWVAIPRAVRTLVSGLAVFSLVLAAVGVFGVVAWVVRNRTGELGVRMALGASPTRLRQELLGRSVPMVALGVAAGLGAGIAAAQAARSVLFGVEPTDAGSLALAVAVMTGTAFVATYLPARRVSAIDPSEAMRVE